MEWLINRRRMMFNRVIPPEYLTFEDAEFWRICCQAYGDNYEIVTVDNGDNTVTITTSFVSKFGDTSTTKKRTLISQETADNTGGEYVAGTTYESIGITQSQCDGVNTFAAIRTPANIFYNKTNINSLSDFQKFRNCEAIDGSNSGVGSSSGFKGDSNIGSIVFPVNFNSIRDNAFYGCSSITNIDVSNIVYIGYGGLRAIKALSLVFDAITSIARYGIVDNTVLEYVDLPSSITNISRDNFVNCKKTLVLVCRATTVPTLGANNTRIGAIYVPQSAIDDYKAAKNWSAQASKIQAIEGTWYENHRELEPTT